MKLSIEAFSHLCHQLFTKHGFTPAEAAACTDEIVEAQCRGRFSHGAEFIHFILTWKKTKSGEPQLVKETPILAHIIGNGNIGPLLAKQAMDIAIDKATRTGIGIVGVDNPWPFLLAGYNPRRAALQGLIGMNWSAATSKLALWGGSDPLIGTNPIGIAIPTNDKPIVLDMDMTEAPIATIRRASQFGLPIPEGAALSAAGEPTTDAVEAMQGAILPFGNYKGSGLGVIIELLGGPFVGAKAGKSVKGNRGMVFLAIQCDLFVSQEKFLTDVSRFVAEVKDSSVRVGFDEILLPGERSEKLAQKARSEGIELDDSVYHKLMKMI